MYNSKRGKPKACAYYSYVQTCLRAVVHCSLEAGANSSRFDAKPRKQFFHQNNIFDIIINIIAVHHYNQRKKYYCQQQTMILTVEAHVQFGAAAIKMTYSQMDNIDCMSANKLREWKGAFGQRPIVCCEAWTMIQSKAAARNLSVSHFYWALYWMKTYQSETETARDLSTTPKTLREKVKDVVVLLSQHMHIVVSNKC
jgi:hypothetical protein